MRVVDIINISSSADTLLKQRVLAMRASGFDNRIICADGPYVRPLREAGVPVHTVHLPRGLDPFRLAASLVEIAVYLRKNKVDVVHTHCSIPGAVGRLAAWLAGVPVIIHTVHGFHFHEDTPWLKRQPYLFVERVCGLVTDTLLTQNRSDLERAERYGIGPRRRRRWIGNGIDLRRFHPVPRAPQSEPVVTITCVARLEPVKNHTMLFEAARLLKMRGESFRIRLVGGGGLRRDYQQLCERLGIADRVELLGYRDDIPEILAQTDIAVLTSLKEGLPRAVVEPMAMGIPVVATHVTGTCEAVQHGETGLTVEPGDVAGLAAALSLLIGDPARRAEMGARGRAVAVRSFDERTVVETLRRIYRDRVLNRSGVTTRVFPTDGGRDAAVDPSGQAAEPELGRHHHVPRGVA